MNTFIDLPSWERRDVARFFSDFLSPWYSVTTELDCTRAFRESKERRQSFFLRYLHAVVCAANEVEAMRYRLQPDGRIALYDRLDVITPIAAEGRPFVTVRIPYIADFAQFAAEATRIIRSIKPDDSPYAVEEKMFADEDYGVIHLSAVPKMFFTSMTFTTHRPGQACTHPLSVVGRMTDRGNGRLVLPYAIYVNHAFVDGAHLTDLFARISSRL